MVDSGRSGSSRAAVKRCLGVELAQERLLFVAAAMALPTAMMAAIHGTPPNVRAAWAYPSAALDTAGRSEHPTLPCHGQIGLL